MYRSISTPSRIYSLVHVYVHSFNLLCMLTLYIGLPLLISCLLNSAICSSGNALPNGYSTTNAFSAWNKRLLRFEVTTRHLCDGPEEDNDGPTLLSEQSVSGPSFEAKTSRIIRSATFSTLTFGLYFCLRLKEEEGRTLSKILVTIQNRNKVTMGSCKSFVPRFVQ
jgi:hypothetical protein